MSSICVASGRPRIRVAWARSLPNRREVSASDQPRDTCRESDSTAPLCGSSCVAFEAIENLRAANARLTVVAPTALLLVLVLLVVAFRRVRPALIILLNVPFAITGGVLALALRDLSISMSAAIGFIALAGVAVLNGVVFMDDVLHREDSGADPRTAASAAAERRLRPVLMTAGVAALGFVPMMVATGVGAEVQRPLATVVVGGLVTSTLLTLLLLPTLYPWLGGKARSGVAAIKTP